MGADGNSGLPSLTQTGQRYGKNNSITIVNLFERRKGNAVQTFCFVCICIVIRYLRRNAILI